MFEPIPAFRATIKEVDIHGFQGREFHPCPSDVCAEVTAIGRGNVMEGIKLGPNDPEKMFCFLCLTKDGRTLELMDFELDREI